MSAKSFVIYRSSAGSGKTYTLTKEYLKLALKRNKYYKHILAVTFTNKAMQEMKDRIVQKLYEFSTGKLDVMAEEIMAYHQLDTFAFQQKCKDTLTDILHGYSHFSISTIDTFFQKIIRSFAKELGLAGSYKLEMDIDLVLMQIVDDLLFEVTENKQVREWIISFARENLQEGNSWDVRKNIKDLAYEIFQENFKQIETEISQQDANLTKNLKKQLDEVIKTFENKMDAFSKEGFKILKNHGLDVADFSYGNSGAMGHLNKISKDKKSYEPGKRLQAALDGGSWYAKKSTKAGDIDTALAAGLQDALNQSVDYFNAEHQAYTTAVQVKKFFYGYGLLADLSRKLQEYKRDNDVMLISDATRFLKELVQNADAPFVYEKAGSFYQHFLIDEFQDTSGFQWDSFKPLVDNSLAEGNKNLVVGDIKQSIYRWRGGDWELLLHKIESDIGSLRTQNEVLDTNFRSEANIIQFNNSLFKQMPTTMVGMASNGIEEWKVLEKVYEDTYQNIPPHKSNDPQGYVNISFLKDEEEYSWKEQVAERLPLLIEELQDANVPLKDIAILVRRNREGQAVTDFLTQYIQEGKAKEGYRYDVVSNESLFLIASPVIRLIIASLRYLYDKNDKVVQAEMVYEYQKGVLEADISESHIFQSISAGELEKWLPQSFVEAGDHVLYLPFYELVEAIIDYFSLNRSAGQYAYLQTFQDLVLKFSQNEKGDIHSFLEWWNERASKESIKVSDDLDAIRIETIHKSKGLEYTSVILPFCDWEIDHKRSPIIWTITDKPPFNIGHLPLKYKKELANTYYGVDYEEERIKAHLDSLNMLYVALTRAAHNLWIFAPDKRNNIAEVMKNTLKSGQFELAEHFEPESNVFEFGSRDFKLEKEETVVSTALTLDAYQHFHWRGKLAVKQDADDFLQEEEDGRRMKINYGILIHKLLSKIHYMDDKERALTALYYEEGLNAEQKTEIEELLGKLLGNNEVQEWYAKGWTVYNEMPIITPQAEYRLDRVMLRAGKAVVVDYKTGLPKNEDVKQMKRYKNLLNEMGYEEAEGYLWYLAENRVQEVN